MQNSVAATSIAIFIFSICPVLPMASMTKSRASFTLHKIYKKRRISVRVVYDKMCKLEMVQHTDYMHRFIFFIYEFTNF